MTENEDLWGDNLSLEFFFYLIVKKTFRESESNLSDKSKTKKQTENYTTVPWKDICYTWNFNAFHTVNTFYKAIEIIVLVKIWTFSVLQVELKSCGFQRLAIRVCVCVCVGV